MANTLKKSCCDNEFHEIASRLCESYQSGVGTSFIGYDGMPQHDVVISLLEMIWEVLFPGYSGRHSFSEKSQYFTVGGLLDEISRGLTDQIHRACSYGCKLQRCQGDCDKSCYTTAQNAVTQLFRKLPEIRELLLLDVQAALDGDPATVSPDEIILAYPGFRAIAINRIAHNLYENKIPLLPRIMSEYAHTMTGIDINPGATIGKRFFIDHGTGVVIGETAVIGDNVKLYQGVTLGALSFPKDSCGQLIKGNKRHPNIESDVTIYAGATILGNVTIGHHSIIGGNVWLTENLEPYSKVTFAPSDIQISRRKPR